LEEPRIDSLHGDEEGDEADLLVPSVLREVLWGGGAMARTVMAVAFFLLSSLAWRGRRKKGGGDKGEQVSG
jgi:hypothetical protein